MSDIDSDSLIENDEVTYGVTQRGKPQLIYQGQFYLLNKTTKSTGRERWICENVDICKGSLSLGSDGIVKLNRKHILGENCIIE